MTDSNDQTDKTPSRRCAKSRSYRCSERSSLAMCDRTSATGARSRLSSKRRRRVSLAAKARWRAPAATITVEKSAPSTRVPPPPPVHHSPASSDVRAGRVLSNQERSARERALAAARAEDANRAPEVEPIRFETVPRPPEPQPRIEEQPQPVARSEPAGRDAASGPPRLYRRSRLQRRRLPHRSLATTPRPRHANFVATPVRRKVAR